jgi:hypothetical protein
MGETDVPGLYAYLMMQLHDLTGDSRYVDEAIKAAEDLRALDFNIGYQFNNAGWSTVALARLWRHTGQELYLNLSQMCIASILQYAFLWDCKYGYAKYYITFFGLTPLREGAYIAPYEELEVFSAFGEYLRLVPAEQSPAAHLLLTEYIKYTTFGPMCSYPGQLPPEVIADEPRNGHINRDLAIPLEDIYQGWEKAGQVGQEIYGAGLAPGIVTRACHRIEGAPFVLFCQYPVRELHAQAGENRCTVRLYGDPRLTCLLRLIPKNGKLREVTLTMKGHGQAITLRHGDKQEWQHEVPGGAQIELTWKTK